MGERRRVRVCLLATHPRPDGAARACIGKRLRTGRDANGRGRDRRVEDQRDVVRDGADDSRQDEHERDVPAPGEDGGVRGVPASFLRGILGARDDPHDARGERGDHRRRQLLNDEHAISLASLEQGLDRALFVRETIEQARTRVGKQFDRDRPGRRVDRVLRFRAAIDAAEELRTQLREDGDLGLEELSLRAR